MTEFPVEQFLQGQSSKLGQSKGRFNAQSNYASTIGGSCLRQLVYARTSAAQALPLDDVSMSNILEGNDQEQAVIRWLQDMGYNFIRSQEAFSIDEALIHGKIDGVIILREGGIEVGKWAAEIKSIQPEIYEQLNTQEDIQRSPSLWHRKWYAQLQLAIRHTKDTRGFGPYGVMLLKDKTRKRVKPISFTYDEAEIQECIQKGVLINQYVASGTLPDRISYASGACKYCDYRMICNPEEIFLAGKNIDDAEFLEKLREYHASKAVASRADKLWDFIKETLRGVQYATCGEFQIEGKERKGGGWVTTITQVFTPAVDELTSRPRPVATSKENTRQDLNPSAEPAVNVFNELSILIESAQTIANLQAVRGPAKAARHLGAITPEQSQQLADLYERKAKCLQKGRVK